MSKTILISGATDGIGLLTAKMLAQAGHQVLLHGRSASKLEAAVSEIGGSAKIYTADLSRMGDVVALAAAVSQDHSKVDVIINNAGVLKAPEVTTAEGHDLRFMVNTFAPYALTQALLPCVPKDGRVVNLSSAAQAAVDLDVLHGRKQVGDMEAYAQSKLAITIWSQEMARDLSEGPVVVAVNPGSLLASKMVKEGFGIAGNDLSIGADILCRAALEDTFAAASGLYFDNDSGRFAPPHAAASDAGHCAAVMQALQEAVQSLQK